MKVTTLTFCSLLFALSVFGQTKMVIHKTNGQKDTVATAEINKITFFVAEIETTITDFDGNIYHTVQIGNQLWTVENLRTTKYNDGTAITKITIDDYIWTNTTIGAYCAFNNHESNVSAYGYLYNWHAVNTGKLAPDGWRVPTDEDWTILTDFVGGLNAASIKLKATYGWYNNSNGTDDYGFNALPGGLRFNDAIFSSLGSFGFWWSSTVNGSTYAWGRSLDYNLTYMGRSHPYQSYGLSVRLVRDL